MAVPYSNLWPTSVGASDLPQTLLIFHLPVNFWGPRIRNPVPIKAMVSMIFSQKPAKGFFRTATANQHLEYPHYHLHHHHDHQCSLICHSLNFHNLSFMIQHSSFITGQEVASSRLFCVMFSFPPSCLLLAIYWMGKLVNLSGPSGSCGGRLQAVLFGVELSVFWSSLVVSGTQPVGIEDEETSAITFDWLVINDGSQIGRWSPEGGSEWAW